MRSAAATFRSCKTTPIAWRRYCLLAVAAVLAGVALVPGDGPARAQAPASPSAAPATAPTAQDQREAENLGAEGWKLWNERKLPQAEAKFQAAVAKDPTNANAWNGLGWAQQNQGKTANAKASFEKAVQLDPKTAAAWNGLGWIARAEGKTDEAIGHWEKAVQAVPTATAALAGLATAYIERKHPEKAKEYYQTLARLEPNSEAVEAIDALKDALPAAETWVKLLDDGQYDESWSAGASLFRNAMKKDQWSAAAKAARVPLGKVVSRRVLSSQYMTKMPGAPDGRYVVIQFATEFENKKEAVETVTPMLDADKTWHVSGYYVK